MMSIDKKSILYVDDEEINLRLFFNTFRREFTIFLAISAKEALEILANEKIDLMITDQRMPNMTGVELLAEVQQIFPEIPPNRLIISGYSDLEDIEVAYEKYHLYRFVAKPWDKDELLSIIKQALENE